MSVVEPSVLVSDEGPVWVISFNRPDRRNSLNLEDRRAWLRAVAEAETDEGCRAIVLTGSGNFFCAGGDIRTMSSDPTVARTRMQAASDVARALVHSPKPVVSAVEGGAFGLGLAVATASDVVVAAENARLAASFGRLGLVADTGISWSLAQRVGRARAKEILLFSMELTAREAQREGIVNLVVPPGRALEVAVEHAAILAAAAPGMIRATKRMFAQPAQDLESLLTAETEAQVELMAGADFAEGQRAFLERRRPVFTGR